MLTLLYKVNVQALHECKHTVSTCLSWTAAFNIEALQPPFFLHAHSTEHLQLGFLSSSSGLWGPVWFWKPPLVCLIALPSSLLCMCVFVSVYVFEWVYISVSVTNFLPVRQICWWSSPGVLSSSRGGWVVWRAGGLLHDWCKQTSLQAVQIEMKLPHAWTRTQPSGASMLL